ncbi:carbohydrate-binding family 9-like protein [Reichenbachiella ulvae]|uniref:Carbohydrate-binding family 9-like protein n=1 Tax=Reichenbachiella ulvae TaxID=2980104 RepID=A0ABT3CNL1_9BACT|nr:carbohydrate-binding family 9-like protein [Reichenbachiella ulvae]MCV9385331.1 carbohydrate-binding family 9-like protein [Reichenbachiella ulvae]
MFKFSQILSVLFLFTIWSIQAQHPHPQHYLALSANETINIDGSIDEPDWQRVEWSADFVDIEGEAKPAPLYRTRMKMLWDEDYLYIAAEMEEPHLWATYDQKDMIIFHENDFEVFIDPDGDTHQYYELEVNALGTDWDLMLVKPYRDGGPAVDAWDIQGLKKGIVLNGTLNDPGDTDEGWTLELALPWAVLEEAAIDGQRPAVGDHWRINFSRVNWRTEAVNGEYQKQVNPQTGKPYPEYNWVWSPQGVIAMHQPETWGYVSFVNQKEEASVPKDFEILMELRAIYQAQKNYYQQKGRYSDDLNQLGLTQTYQSISISFTPSSFEAIIDDPALGTWHINSEGRTWKSTQKEAKNG